MPRIQPTSKLSAGPGIKPLNDSLVVEFLVQLTRDVGRPIEWLEHPEGGFTASWNDVSVEVCGSHSSRVARLFITLRFQDEEVHLAEPLSGGLFGWRVEEEDQRRLSESMRLLEQLVSQQCLERRKWSEQRVDQIRGEIYRRLVFGEVVTTPR